MTDRTDLFRPSRPFFWLATLTVGTVALALSALVDLPVARWFFSAETGFLGNVPVGAVARRMAALLPFIILAAFGLHHVLGRLGFVARRHGTSLRSLVFLVLTMALGPGLIVNGVLKEISHRPRPVQISEFGGSLAYRPFWQLDGGCRRNCSFPSGEAAGAFWTLAPASLAPLPWRLPAVATALAFGAATGTLRLAFGGHFLSDVLASAVLMGFLVFGLRVWLIEPDERRDADQ